MIPQSIVPAAIVLAAALLAAPMVRAVTVSLTLASDRTWPFSLERPDGVDRPLMVASRGRGG